MAFCIFIGSGPVSCLAGFGARSSCQVTVFVHSLCLQAEFCIHSSFSWPGLVLCASFYVRFRRHLYCSVVERAACPYFLLSVLCHQFCLVVEYTLGFFTSMTDSDIYPQMLMNDFGGRHYYLVTIFRHLV